MENWGSMESFWTQAWWKEAPGWWVQWGEILVEALIVSEPHLNTRICDFIKGEGKRESTFPV